MGTFQEVVKVATKEILDNGFEPIADGVWKVRRGRTAWIVTVAQGRYGGRGEERTDPGWVTVIVTKREQNGVR